MQLARSLEVAITAVLAFACIGCGGAPPKPTLMANTASEDVSIVELRAADYEFASRFAQLVAMCAMSIVDQTEDPETRERALIWRMYASPQARSAAFNQDPLAGLIELWALAAQQRAFFTDGEGEAAFGDQQGCVTETTKQLEREVEQLAATIMPDERFELWRKTVAEWVALHPIEGRLFVRPTAQADLAALVDSAGQGGLKAVGSMEETLRDLNDRLSILSVQMPLEARWQAEYLIDSLFEERFSEPVETLVQSMDDVSRFLREFEDTLANQTTRLLDAFTFEREAAFASIEEERESIVDAIDAGRATVVDSLDAEIDEALNRLEATGRGLIDHFFERLIGVLVAMGVFIFIMVALLIGGLRRRDGTPASASSETPESD